VTQRRRLLYLTLETPHPGQASYTHVHEIISGLRGLDWEVELHATNSGGASSGSSYFSRVVDYLRTQLHLARRLKEADALYARAHFAALPSAWLARAKCVPVFQELNGRPDDIFVTYSALRWLSPLIVWMYKWQLMRADHVFAVTRGLDEWVARCAAHERHSVVGNAANTQVFTPDGPPSPVTGRYAAFVGGLVRWHGIPLMLAARREPNWPADVQLVIVGDGVERQALTSIKDGDGVIAMGRLPQDLAAAVLRGALCSLCVIEDPDGRSNSGVAPLKLYESMASGVPVVVSDLPFQSDLVRDVECGLVVPLGNPEALAQAVAELAEDPQRAKEMGRKGAAHVRQTATWRHRAAEISAVIAASINRKQVSGDA
jgi:glycosyltransferase involved in cell wall biosynthesis